MLTPMTPPPRPVPDKDAIDALPPFPRLGRDRVTLVRSAGDAVEAVAALRDAPLWGFDTESKPTFRRDEVSDGPHIVQLATRERAWVFQLHDPGCRERVADLLAAGPHRKAGFGLRDDTLRVRARLGVEPQGVVELNALFRAQGYRKDMGVKAAVAVLFGQRFAKSKKTATSNWAAATLNESQLLYAANDAWAAWHVAAALGVAAD
jgi:ribonuclease D